MPLGFSQVRSVAITHRLGSVIIPPSPRFAQVRKKISKLQNAMQEFGERFNQEELIRQAEAGTCSNLNTLTLTLGLSLSLSLLLLLTLALALALALAPILTA